MDKLIRILLVVCLVVLSACSATMQPFYTEGVQPGFESKVSRSLKELPGPEQKVVAAVYRFNDQTGQYKPSEQVASWSTAVTQGSTAILIKAMENSGWFVPIEREGLSNLLNERKIISSTRAQNNDQNGLPPLLFAGIILEGGIIGYDTNVITGGAGVRYFGVDGSGQFRKDQVTIYLRAVSSQTGRILKTVHTTKSIISQELSGGVFRFVDTNRLLEAEAGFTFNEPPVMAVTEAIDEALKTLIVEGVDDGLWSPRDPGSFSAYRQKFYEAKKEDQQQERDYFGLNRNSDLRKGLDVSANAIYGSHIGSYPDSKEMAGGAVQLEYFLSPSLSIKANGQRSKLGATNVFSEYYLGFDLKLRKYFTPAFKLSPYVGLGGGGIVYEKSPILISGRDYRGKGWILNRFYPTANAQAGLDYRFSEFLGFQVGFDYRYLIRDGIDGIKVGSIHDQQWNVLLGFTISPKIIGR